jgi:MoaA/NifB/PqqE/SkfB family radical SAM enzyme
MEKIKIAIWGQGLFATILHTLVRLTAPEDMELVCFGAEEAGTFEGVPVLSLPELAEKYASGEIHVVILAVSNTTLFQEQIKLLNAGIRDLYYLPRYAYDLPLGETSIDLLERIDETRPRLEYLEYHIADHCNLNCKGCGHFSNVCEPGFGDLSQFRKDLERLRELVWGIKVFRLMGGEPLLNPELPEFVRAAREVFPDADIHVVSNGLALDDSKIELLQTMAECHVNLDISQYPPAEAKKDRILALCRLMRVNCYFTDPIRVFRNCLDPAGENDIAASHQACDVKQCHFLSKGKAAGCILPFILPLANQNLHAEMQESPEDVIDLYDPSLDGFTLIQKLRSPMQTCRYCDPAHTNAFEWGVANRHVAKPEDWLARK